MSIHFRGKLLLVLASQLEVLGVGALVDYPRAATPGESGVRAELDGRGCPIKLTPPPPTSPADAGTPPPRNCVSHF